MDTDPGLADKINFRNTGQQTQRRSTGSFTRNGLFADRRARLTFAQLVFEHRHCQRIENGKSPTTRLP